MTGDFLADRRIPETQGAHVDQSLAFDEQDLHAAGAQIDDRRDRSDTPGRRFGRIFVGGEHAGPVRGTPQGHGVEVDDLGFDATRGERRQLRAQTVLRDRGH